MAINFAGLLGGLGSGAQQLAAQREQERQFNINRQFAERQFAESQLGRQQQYELQKSAAERADALAERQSKELRNKELGLANQSVVSLLSADLQDEEKALEELRQPGLSPTDIEGIRERRRKRRKVVEDALASFDKMTGYSDLFGSALSRLQASPIAGTDALRVTPKVNWTQYAGFLQDARKAIAAAAPADQEGEWQNQISQLATITGAPIEEVQTKLARPGSVLPGVKPLVTAKERAPTSAELGIYGPTPVDTAKALREMSFGQLAVNLQQGLGISQFPVKSPLMPGLQPSEVTPGGGKVERAFDPLTGMVTATETAPPSKVKYTTPETELLRAEAQRLKNEETRLLMDPKVKAALEDVTTKRLRNILTQKQINWYDIVEAAKITNATTLANVKKAQAAAKAGAQKGITLADEIRMFNAESLNAYRDSQSWLASAKMREGRINGLTRRIDELEKLASAAEVKAAESADKALKNVQSASLKVAKDLRAQAAQLRTQLGYIESGNINGMASSMGSAMGGFNPATASAADLSTNVQAGQARIQNLMQTGVQGMQSGMQGQQQQQGQGQGGVLVDFRGANFAGGGQPGAAGAAGMVGPNGQPLNFNDPATLMAMIQALAGKGGMGDAKPTPEIAMGRWDELRRVFPNLTDSDIRVYLKPDGSLVPEGKTLLTALNKRKGEAMRKGATKFAENVQRSGGLFGRKPEPNRGVTTPRSQPVVGGSGPALN